MAVLKESDPWPIHSARRLHDKAQQAYLWQFYMTGIIPQLNEDMMMLAQAVTIPGFSWTQKSYKVAGQEQYYQGDAKRGGVISARFIETEGGDVDTFFRAWANLIDIPSPGIVGISRWRRGRGFGDGVTGHARTGIARLMKRNGEVSVEFVLTRLQLIKFGGYDLSYGTSGPLIVTIEMTCDDVIRNIVRDVVPEL